MERGFRRRPHRETVARLAESLELNGEDRERLSGAVPRSRKMVFATPAARDEAATEIARSELSPVGCALGAFVIEASLGSGRYSEVYIVRARDGLRYAAKWLKRDCPSDGADRIINEEWALRELERRHVDAVPRIIASGSEDDRPYLVMTIAHGETLSETYRHQLSEGRTLSESKTLRIAGELLRTISQLHRLGMSHRDIHPGNIIVGGLGDPSFERSGNVTLIDFGTVYSADRPRDVAPFWNEGSSRFSPPDKLRYPARVVPSQDTFAIGVLAYLLMTNAFPWSVNGAERGDRGALEDLMRGSLPRSIRDFDVSAAVSDFVAGLLDPDDGRRPSPVKALEQLRVVTAQTQPPAPPQGVQGAGRPGYATILMDPVHGHITLTEFELKIIRTPEIQRLARLRKLGTANVVFPGAEHNRFQHALGSMHVMTQIMRRYEERCDVRIEADTWLAARAFALVRNVGTPPFADALVSGSGVLPDDRRLAKALTGSTEFADLLHSDSIGPMLRDLADGVSADVAWIARFFEDPCGPDVLDSVVRDAYFTGVSAATLNTRLYDSFAAQDDAIRFGRRVDVEAALLDLVMQRYWLLETVHGHKQKVAADAMLAKSVWLTITATRELGAADVESMADEDLMFALIRSVSPLARQLAVGVRERRLWKPVFSAALLSSTVKSSPSYPQKAAEISSWGLSDPSGRARIEAAICRRVGVRPDAIIIHCPAQPPGVSRLSMRRETSPLFYDKLVSHYLRLWKVRCFVAPDVASDTAAVARLTASCEDFLQYVNEPDGES